MPKNLSVQIEDIEALAAMLKSPRARKLLQSAAKKGRGPALTITAALTASLVSAAAEENKIDPLGSLQAVDDLSQFGEICLPGQKYAEAGHVHGEGDDHASHDLSHNGPSWLADRFTSRLANKYARDHDGHDEGEHDMDMRHGSVASHDHNAGHNVMTAPGSVQGEHCDAPVATAATTSGHDHHAKDVSETGHPNQDSHSGDTTNAHTGHEGHQAAAHHSPQSSSSAHAGHAVDAGAAPVDHSAHYAPDSAADLSHAEDQSDLDQYVAALTDDATADAEQTQPASDAVDTHHDHGVTLAAFDTPSADDLSLATSAVPHI